MTQPTHDLHECVFTAETEGQRETNENVSEHKGTTDEGTQDKTPPPGAGPGAGVKEDIKYKEGTPLVRFEGTTAHMNNNINLNTKSFQW